LKYFTFCAVGALDVLLLDREKIIRRSATTKEFDTVYFFDRNEESVVETRKRIPGANGFPGDFVKVVLQAQEGDDAISSLDSPADRQNTREVRELQNQQAQLQRFIEAFPFDVINLDVEQYLFHPREDLPGNLTNALRKLFAWQKRDGQDSRGKHYSIDEFTLMFTTQIGPPNLPEPYLRYLRDTCLQQNLTKFDDLTPLFLRKSKGTNLATFFADNFAEAFKLAVPKSVIELALENDWHIEGADGVEVFQFNRDSKDGAYQMLHMAMTVRRQKPARERRGPGEKTPAEAEAGHRQAIQRLFEREAVAVEALVKGGRATALKADLKALFEHREKYYNPASDAAS